MVFHIPYTHGQMDNSDIISSIQWIAMMIKLGYLMHWGMPFRHSAGKISTGCGRPL